MSFMYWKINVGRRNISVWQILTRVFKSLTCADVTITSFGRMKIARVQTGYLKILKFYVTHK